MSRSSKVDHKPISFSNMWMKAGGALKDIKEKAEKAGEEFAKTSDSSQKYMKAFVEPFLHSQNYIHL